MGAWPRSSSPAGRPASPALAGMGTRRKAQPTRPLSVSIYSPNLQGNRQRAALEALTGGRHLGDVTSGAISSTASMAATGAMLGSVFPVVGTAIGAAVGAALGFLQSLFGSSTYHKEEAQATKVVNLIETEMHQNLARYQAGLHEYSQQQAALAYFDQLWAGIEEGCTDLGSPGQRCISERQRGGKYDYYAFSRDPIANDPNVVADAGGQLVVDGSGNLVGEIPAGSCAPDDTMMLVPVGSTFGSGQRVSCTDVAATTGTTPAGSTSSTTGSIASILGPNINILGYSVNPLYLAGAAVALVVVMSMGGDGK